MIGPYLKIKREQRRWRRIFWVEAGVSLLMVAVAIWGAVEKVPFVPVVFSALAVVMAVQAAEARGYWNWNTSERTKMESPHVRPDETQPG